MKKLWIIFLLIPILCYSAPVRIKDNQKIRNRQKIEQIKKNNGVDKLFNQKTDNMDLIQLKQYVGKLSLLVKDLVNMMGE